MTELPTRKITIRGLDRAADFDAVAGVFDNAQDYVRLEGGETSGQALAADFFDEWPDFFPPETRVNLGLFLGTDLAGIIEAGGAWPQPDDAYIGLMLFAPAFRGQGLGERFLAAYRDLVLGHGATRIVLGVLHNNPRARAFWTRLGFQVDKADVTVRHGRLADRLALNISQLPSVDGPGS
ncbi:MAG: GNAT family N-acetyltransferase [Hyphomicrobiaceae bacterium]|nr:GNAT family N-acetyltransferase [Hyphomicrobiaceae bacterium]